MLSSQVSVYLIKSRASVDAKAQTSSNLVAEDASTLAKILLNVNMIEEEMNFFSISLGSWIWLYIIALTNQ